MKITEVTYGLTLTQSLPGYCNVKASTSMTATIEKGEDPILVRQSLAALIYTELEEEINMALEAANKKARYHSGPTYQIMTDHQTWAVLPDSIDEVPNGWYYSMRGGDNRGLRLENAIDKAQAIAESRNEDFLDCSDGDLSKLPPQPEDEEETLSKDYIPF